MATASASVPESFEAPGPAPGTAVAPEVDTTTVFETSTYYFTSAMIVTSARINSTAGETSTCADSAPPAEPTASLHVTGNQTFVPVTLWEGSTTRVVFPQNSTALAMPTGYPTNGTSTVVVTATAFSSSSSSSSDKTVATTPKHKTSATASASASVSEVPDSSAAKLTGNPMLGMGAVAGLMAFL